MKVIRGPTFNERLGKEVLDGDTGDHPKERGRLDPCNVSVDDLVVHDEQTVEDWRGRRKFSVSVSVVSVERG